MAFTSDRETTDLAVYAPEQIGRTRYRTPEGFLYCEGVRIARTGPMIYAASEMPDIEPGPHSTMIVVERDAEVLFHPDNIKSYAGKAVTNDHPPEPVTPANFKKYSVGTVLNPRRGEGAEANYLLADLLIMDETAIEAVDPPPGQNPKVQVSAGYDSDVEQIKPGLGRQTVNEGNHVALVERGRAGPSCAIQDEEPDMAKKTRRIIDGIRKAFKLKDEEALEQNLTAAEGLMDDDEDDETTHRIVIEVAKPDAATTDEGGEGGSEKKDDPYEARFKGIEDALVKFGDTLTALGTAAKPTTDEEAEKKPDEELTDEEAKEEEKEADKPQTQDAMSKAEILAPGIKLPVQDGASPLKRSAVTAFRRSALKTAVADSARKVHVEAVLGGRAADFDKMRPGEVRMIFDAAAAVAKASNNAGGVRAFDIPEGRMTAAKMQENIEARRKAAK